MKQENKIGIEMLKTHKRFECVSCANDMFVLCKVEDNIFPDIVCSKCGCIYQK